MTTQAYWTDALPRPYESSDKVRELSRLSADIPYSDKDLIKKVCPKKGVLNQITQCFFAAVCENLRNQNINYYSPNHESYLIDLIKSILTHARGYRRQSVVESLDHAFASNDGGGVAGALTETAGGVKQQRKPKAGAGQPRKAAKRKTNS